MKLLSAYHFKLFCEQHPDFLASDRNLDILANYWRRHNVFVATFIMLESLYRRFIAAGIEFDRKPEPSETEPAPGDYRKRATTPIRIAALEKPEPVTYAGFDLVTGEPRVYSAREIDRMPADDMRRALRMKTNGTLPLPVLGPGPKGKSY